MSVPASLVAVGVGASYPVALVGGSDMEPFSCVQLVQREARPGSFGGVRAVEVGVIRLESLTVKAVARGVVPGGPPAGAVQFLRGPVHHDALQYVFDCLGLGGQCLDLRQQVKVGGGLRVQFVHTHCGILLRFVWGAGREFVRAAGLLENAFPAPFGFEVYRLIDLECRFNIRFTSIPFSGSRPVCPPLGVPSF